VPHFTTTYEGTGDVFIMGIFALQS